MREARMFGWKSVRRASMGLVLLLATLGTGPAQAVVVDFEDVTADISAEIPDDYMGLNWANFLVMDPARFSGEPPAYANGLVSGTYVGLSSANQTTATVLGTGLPFDFLSAYLTFNPTPGSLDPFQLSVNGYLGGTLVGSRVLGEADVGAATLVDFSFAGIDRLDFVRSGGTGNFVMDDFTFQTVVPEPGTALLLGTGLATLVGCGRGRNARRRRTERS